MFGDIVGFTSWSSSREPSDVFTFLETIYGEFDRLGKYMENVLPPNHRPALTVLVRQLSNTKYSSLKQWVTVMWQYAACPSRTQNTI